LSIQNKSKISVTISVPIWLKISVSVVSLLTILPASTVAVAAPDVASADAAAGAEGFTWTTIGRSSFQTRPKQPTSQQEPNVSLGQQSAEDLSFHQDQNNHENHKAKHRKKFHFGSKKLFENDAAQFLMLVENFS
jgi:hypothetical protein